MQIPGPGEHNVYSITGWPGLWAQAAPWIILGYALGSIPFGYLLVRLAQGRDIRTTGSGNIGAANVTRTAGKGLGILTLFLDAAKGFLPVWFASHVLPQSAAWVMATGLAAMGGHFFPVWLKLRGGKGVATGVGVFLPICWQAVAGAFVVWVATVALTRYVSLGSMLASASLPVLTYFFYAPGHAPPFSIVLGTTLAAAGIVLKHHENIGRLAAGREPKLKL
jgi:glycerol-3-phosphate acyltransferase PlsY